MSYIKYDGTVLDEADRPNYREWADGCWYPTESFESVRNGQGEYHDAPVRILRSTYVRCAVDNVYVHIQYVSYVENVGYVSTYRLRRSSDYRVCNRCGCWYLAQDLDENGHCESCAQEILEQEEEESDSLIKSCECRDYPAALGKGPIRYGVELEVEVSDDYDVDDVAERVQDTLGGRFVLLKEDGSINNGFEIVTAPASLQEHINRWPSLLENGRASAGLSSWDPANCGMHVHVSRAPLSQLQIGKMLVMVNHPNWTEFIKHMAGRAANSYCHRIEKKFSDAKHYPDDRYQAINLRRDKTIEFRIFRGSIKWERVRGNLEFVDAVVAYTTPATQSLREVDKLENFLSFLDKRRKRWPALANRLVKHNYIKAPKKDERTLQSVATTSV